VDERERSGSTDYAGVKRAVVWWGGGGFYEAWGGAQRSGSAVRHHHAALARLYPYFRTPRAKWLTVSLTIVAEL